MSNLREHAGRELALAFAPNPRDTPEENQIDAEYNNMVQQAVLELIRVFSTQGHSGFSARLVIQLFTRLAAFEALTPITNNPDEWIEVADDLWQNKRHSSAFSKDGGQTYVLNEEQTWFAKIAKPIIPFSWRRRLPERLFKKFHTSKEFTA